MHISNLFQHSFKVLHRQLSHKPSLPAVQLSSDSDFCREVVARGWLTQEQMVHAAERYCLGRSRSGKTIFWMIDELGIVRDGHIGDSWASVMMKQREPKLLREWHTEHCLFGLQTLPHPLPVWRGVYSIVERETSAVILSELYPDCIWLASVYPMNFNVDSFEPLCGHHVTLFPHTDETMETYLYWSELADQARRKYGLHVTVSSILEDNATPQQKAAHIDLVDFLFGGSKQVEWRPQTGRMEAPNGCYCASH